MFKRLWRWYCLRQYRKHATIGLDLIDQFKYAEGIPHIKAAGEWERRAGGV